MLSAVPNRRRALAAQAGEFSCSGARDDKIGLLRHARHIYKLPRPFLREAKDSSGRIWRAASSRCSPAAMPCPPG
jgi:hypothetical protein